MLPGILSNNCIILLFLSQNHVDCLFLACLVKISYLIAKVVGNHLRLKLGVKRGKTQTCHILSFLTSGHGEKQNVLRQKNKNKRKLENKTKVKNLIAWKRKTSSQKKRGLTV